MDINGKYDHIEDVLVNLHTGQWFGWSDPNNKVYENLIIHDESKDKPSKKLLEDELKKQQDEFDAKSYARAREAQFPSITDVVVALAEKEEGDNTMWQEITAQRAKVKSDNPKPQ